MGDRLNDDPVVITGIGCVSAVGAGREVNWSTILAGKGGVASINRFDASDFPVQIAAQVTEFEPARYMEAKDARRADRFIQFAVAASREAVEHAGLSITDDNAERVGVIIGTAMGGLGTFEEGVRTLQTRGPSRVSP
ncbi:MAG TPA: beta-ketoacyl synthase N-terminal-like domain-containing protein, partial [Thermomicrobiales bacterium]|nr:beta-ketoacyl synthase N-terminal-like domain-containing protein [Thermomicrobiales bacterium]